MPQTNDFQTKVAHFVEVTSAALDDATEKLQARATADAAYATKVAAAVDDLISANVLPASRRDAAIAQLTNPGYAIDQLVKLAKSARPEGPERIGAPVDATPKVASATTAPRGGRMRGAHHDDFVRNLGLDPNALRY